MSRFALVTGLFFLLPVVAFANDNAKALALLKGVEQERLKHDCFHIRYEEHRAEENKTVEQIVDFDKGKIRKKHLPNDFFQGKKSILLEDAVYCMMAYDEQHVAIVPLRSAIASGTGIYDPRMLGLADMMNHEMTVSVCLLYKNRSNFSVSRENLDGRPVHVVEYRDGEENDFAHWKLYIEEPGFFLKRIVMESQSEKIQIDNDYSKREFLPFPTKTHVKRVEKKDEKIIFDRRITVKDVQIKESFPPETFTLAGLNPPLNSDVVDYRISRRLGYWDGEKLVDKPVHVSAQEFRELMEPRKMGMIQYICMGIGVAMILYALFSMYRKRGAKE